MVTISMPILSQPEAITIASAISVLHSAQPVSSPRLTTARSVVDWLSDNQLNSAPGLLGMLFFDAQLQLLGFEKIALSQTVKLAPHYEAMVKASIGFNSHRVLLWKNHKDDQFTPTSHFKNEVAALKNNLSILDTELVDVVVVVNQKFSSMQLEGFL